MSASWSRLLAATWVLVAVAHGFVSIASRRTGKPLWWIDDHGVAGAATPVIGAAIVYALMLMTFIVTLRRVPRSPAISAVVAIVLAISAAADLGTAPGSAIAAVAASASALLASIAALAGRTAHR